MNNKASLISLQYNQLLAQGNHLAEVGMDHYIIARVVNF
jgi:hypothetical protein